MLFLLNLFKNLNLRTSYIKQIMNVFSFVQWNIYFHSVKDEMNHSTRLRLVEWKISSFTHENICTIALINIHYLYIALIVHIYIECSVFPYNLRNACSKTRLIRKSTCETLRRAFVQQAQCVR